jgi:mono/diheme cytochrome c family protein
MSEEKEPTDATEPAPLFGLLAEYPTPRAVIEAAKQVRDAGYRDWDTYTPFPVHGIDKAMGIKMTVLPWIVFGAGLTGFATAVLLQWWTNAVDYAWIVSGKPFWSIPANVPIMFELTVLFSAITALVSMLLLNGLPLPSHPLDLKRRFARVTDDKYFLLIQASDPKFDESETRELLMATQPAVLEDVPEDRVTSDELPTGLVYGLIIAVTASLVPFAIFAMARESKGPSPRIHAVGDMDWQAKFKSQRENTFFADGRSEREPPPGTVAVGDLREDDHFYRGKLNGAWARTFPPQVEISRDTMERGRERFGIYCAPCHGLAGNGDGMVNKRAESLAEGRDGWVIPTNMNQEHLRQQPIGQLFNSVTHGVRNMPAYGSQIKVEDRWAILLYVRALQKSRGSNLSDLTAEERGKLSMR